jgi:hypothetical protein
MTPPPIIRPDEVATCDRGTLCNYRHGLTLRFKNCRRWGWLWRKTYYEGTLSRRAPLMWQDAAGVLYMPDRHERCTDLGSIPPPLRSMFPQDEAPYAYYTHDSAYRHGGLWTAPTLDAPWTFRTMTRRAVDDLCLSAMMEAGGVSAIRRGTIWSQVRLWGWAAWTGTRDD